MVDISYSWTIHAAASVAAGASLSVEYDLIPALLPLLSATSSAVQEMAAFALARLAQLQTYQEAIIQVINCTVLSYPRDLHSRLHNLHSY